MVANFDIVFNSQYFYRITDLTELLILRVIRNYS